MFFGPLDKQFGYHLSSLGTTGRRYRPFSIERWWLLRNLVKRMPQLKALLFYSALHQDKLLPHAVRDRIYCAPTPISRWMGGRLPPRNNRVDPEEQAYEMCLPKCLW
jgi:hypothetical protein